MIDLSNTWMNNPNFLAQSSHFLAGTTIVMTAAYYFGKKGAIVSAIIAALIGIVKEFYYDLSYEIPKQTIFDSSLDMFFYLLGGVAALLAVLFIARRN